MRKYLCGLATATALVVPSWAHATDFTRFLSGGFSLRDHGTPTPSVAVDDSGQEYRFQQTAPLEHYKQVGASMFLEALGLPNVPFYPVLRKIVRPQLKDPKEILSLSSHERIELFRRLRWSKLSKEQKKVLLDVSEQLTDRGEMTALVEFVRGRGDRAWDGFLARYYLPSKPAAPMAPSGEGQGQSSGRLSGFASLFGPPQERPCLDDVKKVGPEYLRKKPKEGGGEGNG